MDLTLFLRMTLTGLSAFLVGFVLFVAWSYMRVFARAARDWRQLLPLHVWTIAVSYVCVLGYGIFDMMGRMHAGEAVTWRMPLLFTADVLGITAMIVIDKLRRVRGNPIKAEEP